MASASSGGSRLTKLLNLIDGGSSLTTRKAAAAQIAGIAAAHPQQLPAVVAAVARHLRHREWDARVAAGHCLGLLAEHFQHHTPADLAAAAAVAAPESKEDEVKVEVKEEAGGPSTSGRPEPAQHLLSFASFDVQQVLAQGTPMLASGGEEYEVPAEAGLSRAEQLRRQRGNLKQRLGLTGPLMDGLMDTDDMFNDEDLLTEDAKSESGGPAGGGRPPRSAGTAGKAVTAAGAAAAGHKDASQLLADMSGMSARERAAAARRAKALKRTSSAVQAGGGGGGKRAKGGASGAGKGGEASASEAAGSAAGSVAELEGSAAEAAEQEWADILEGGRWPFQSLCDQLCVDCLHPCWEVRHGAALALREVLGSSAGSAGVLAAPAAVAGGWRDRKSVV